MKNFIQICLVMMVQFIACYLAGWDMPETGFILAFVLLWQGLFIWLFHQISKKHNTPGEYKFSKVIWYIIMPICSLISPMLSLMIFIFGTLCDLRKVSNCISIKDWMKTQVAVEESDNHVSLDFESVEFSRSNPATGLPMSGIGVDIGGSSYGYSSSHHYR
ncbi:surface exclusion protein [Salmonella enterica subsp. enterica serovar Leoben]|nr:surface exclusion protein [Salmonella enterica subsp. enterica serovar Leoben]ECE9264546.1 surface exclusion protein [Salmonella enterica subsp. enterica serovar Leoben]ECE9398009.1 surface exclusion protein [Salmonella enterica subsp. enterica serovar Leoben]